MICIFCGMTENLDLTSCPTTGRTVHAVAVPAKKKPTPMNLRVVMEGKECLIYCATELRVQAGHVLCIRLDEELDALSLSVEPFEGGPDV